MPCALYTQTSTRMLPLLCSIMFSTHELSVSHNIFLVLSVLGPWDMRYVCSICITCHGTSRISAISDKTHCCCTLSLHHLTLQHTRPCFKRITLKLFWLWWPFSNAWSFSTVLLEFPPLHTWRQTVERGSFEILRVFVMFCRCGCALTDFCDALRLWFVVFSYLYLSQTKNNAPVLNVFTQYFNTRSPFSQHHL